MALSCHPCLAAASGGPDPHRRADPRRAARRRSHRLAHAAGLIALALALAGCRIETSYVPRTPHRLALAMKDGEPAVYKDGILTKIGEVTNADVTCSPTAAADAVGAAREHADYRFDAQIAGICNALTALVPPLAGIGIYFGIRATDHAQRGNVHLVDAINQHNDEPRCQP